MPTPSLPVALKKYEYENTQFDPESPSTLDGVMQRWIVPEGEEEKEPVTMIVPLRVVSIEGGLFPDTKEKEEEKEEEKEGEGIQNERFNSLSPHCSSQSFFSSYFFGFIILSVLNLAFLIILLLTRK